MAARKSRCYKEVLDEGLIRNEFDHSILLLFDKSMKVNSGKSSLNFGVDAVGLNAIFMSTL